jgi:hypothetical protein
VAGAYHCQPKKDSTSKGPAIQTHSGTRPRRLSSAHSLGLFLFLLPRPGAVAVQSRSMFPSPSRARASWWRSPPARCRPAVPGAGGRPGGRFPPSLRATCRRDTGTSAGGRSHPGGARRSRRPRGDRRRGRRRSPRGRGPSASCACEVPGLRSISFSARHCARVRPRCAARRSNTRRSRRVVSARV